MTSSKKLSRSSGASAPGQTSRCSGAAGQSTALVAHSLFVDDYDLAATLTSGQVFRWQNIDGVWEGIVGSRWVRLKQVRNAILAEIVPVASGRPANRRGADWRWLREYLQSDVKWDDVVATFPPDPPLAKAVRACRGLRLLRQDPWECLASFVLSSTKQVVQIRQVIENLCAKFGRKVLAPPEGRPWRAFPSPHRLAACSEAELRDCRMGFRARYLKAAAEAVVGGHLELDAIRRMDLDHARAELTGLPGVGRKIADCVLLFGFGFPGAFPVDVWVDRALRELYLPGSRVTRRQLLEFSKRHFGLNGGYAQQYLFHYRRVVAREDAAK